MGLGVPIRRYVPSSREESLKKPRAARKKIYPFPISSFNSVVVKTSPNSPLHPSSTKPSRQLSSHPFFLSVSASQFLIPQHRHNGRAEEGPGHAGMYFPARFLRLPLPGLAVQMPRVHGEDRREASPNVSIAVASSRTLPLFCSTFRSAAPHRRRRGRSERTEFRGAARLGALDNELCATENMTLLGIDFNSSLFHRSYEAN